MNECDNEISKKDGFIKIKEYTKSIGLDELAKYINGIAEQWNYSLGLDNIKDRSIGAQNIAGIRIFPEYSNFKMPWGFKTVLKSLTKSAALALTKTDDIFFDPKGRNFYHKDFPEKKLSSDQITVVQSSMELFADISLDDLLSFESNLNEDLTFAIEHPVGKKIFNVIRNWNSFINFDSKTYYHARKLDGNTPYLDQEMLKAPCNVSAHGRYNQIGKSCYYVAETKEGAILEVKKHCGSSNPKIQVVGLKPKKDAKLIDLSGEIKGINKFMEHLRFSVDNSEGKIIKQYLLPNYVASCCKHIGIEGIKYKSGKYNCIVLWSDDYFDFIEGSRSII